MSGVLSIFFYINARPSKPASDEAAGASLALSGFFLNYLSHIVAPGSTYLDLPM